jgi:Circularly permutated YpsA SLOG family
MIKIVSGGQTGVDRAALDVALELGFPCGGWCPKGRRAEDGTIPERYPLQETPTDAYPERTEWNVRDSDATLILTRGKPDRGTALTVKLARRLKKPYRIVDLAAADAADAIHTWLISQRVTTLNVAGPRESSQPGIRQLVQSFLRSVLSGG